MKECNKGINCKNTCIEKKDTCINAVQAHTAKLMAAKMQELREKAFWSNSEDGEINDITPKGFPENAL